MCSHAPSLGIACHPNHGAHCNALPVHGGQQVMQVYTEKIKWHLLALGEHATFASNITALERYTPTPRICPCQLQDWPVHGRDTMIIRRRHAKSMQS